MKMKDRGTMNTRESLPPAAGTAGRRERPALDQKTQARIGEQLRAHYDELVSQPVPKHLVEMLNRLDAIGGPANSSEPVSPNADGADRNSDGAGSIDGTAKK